MKLSNFVLISIGDKVFSQDENFLVASTLKGEEIQAAYLKGASLIGLDIVNVCAENSVLSPDQMEKLGKSNFDFHEDFMKEDVINSDDYIEIFFHTVGAGNNNFSWASIEYEDVLIGGDALKPLVN